MRKHAGIILSTLFAVATLSALADAGTIKDTYDVWWRTSQSGVNTQGWVDSADINYSTAAQRADTSTAISTEEWVLPSMYPTTTANDSVGWFRVSFAPASNRTAVAADSIYLTIQVSDDGRVWTAATPTRTFAAAGLDGNNSGLVVREIGTSDQFVVGVRQHSGGAASSTFWPLDNTVTTAPAWTQIFGYRYIRLIVQSDITGHYDATITYFKAK